MPIPLYYFDDPHAGPSRATSHPDFNAIATADFYFDDRTSPFSSEGIGLSVLRILEDQYREKGELGNGVDYIKNGLRTYYGQWGNPAWAWRYVEYGDDKEALIASGIFEREGSQHAQVDFIIIAIAFGQCKIEGKIDPQLKELGLQAIRRRKIDFEYALDLKRKMNEEITVQHPWMKFLKQMQIMEEDLEKFATVWKRYNMTSVRWKLFNMIKDANKIIYIFILSLFLFFVGCYISAPASSEMLLLSIITLSSYLISTHYARSWIMKIFATIAITVIFSVVIVLFFAVTEDPEGIPRQGSLVIIILFWIAINLVLRHFLKKKYEAEVSLSEQATPLNKHPRLKILGVVFSGIAVLVLIFCVGYHTKNLIERDKFFRIDYKDRAKEKVLNEEKEIIFNFYDTFHRLPASLTELNQIEIKEPGSKTSSYYYHINEVSISPFMYTALTTTTFNLCTSFDADTTQLKKKPHECYEEVFDDFWKHPAGTTCFIFNVQDRPVEIIDYTDKCPFLE